MNLFIKLLFILLCICFFSCDTELTDLKNTSAESAHIPVPSTENWWITRHNERKNNVIVDQKIIFIGDSITSRFESSEAWSELSQKYGNKITNLGFEGDQTQHVIWRLMNGEFPEGINAEYAIVMIGTNNRHDPKSIAEGITQIIKVINNNSPITKILLLSILPRGRGISDKHTDRNILVNNIIKKYDGNINVQYVDLVQSFIDTNGVLIEELFIDKLHLTLSGYNLWKNKIFDMID